MATSLGRLNSKEKKRLVEQLKHQFGFSGKLDYVLFRTEKRDKIYLLNNEVADLDTTGLNIDAMGLYFGAEMKNGEFRLSIEGSQIVGPFASKNVLELNDEEHSLWIRGNDLENETSMQGFIILKHGEDFLGSGKPVLDEKTGSILIHNYVPKTRYVR